MYRRGGGAKNIALELRFGDTFNVYSPIFQGQLLKNRPLILIVPVLGKFLNKWPKKIRKL